ncbi:MAG: hypothetical protein JWN32_3998 [Solirubrobacterales bacterium]|nr:hypothetical protein [Solirubrobacterales bacterium]
MTDGVDPARMHDDAASLPARRLAPSLVVVLAYLALMAVVIVGAAGPDIGPVRAPLGLLIGLVAPGSLLLRATVGQRLGSGHAAALTVPLSLAICALSGTVLTLAGLKLTTLSLTLVVCAISLACLLVAIVRRTVLPPVAVRWPAAESLRLTPRTAMVAMVRRTAVPPLAARRLRLTPRTAMAGGLAIAILAMGASTVQQIVRVDDAARAATPFVALTGKLQQATPIAGGVRVRVAFTTINSQPRAIRPRLDISVLPGQFTSLRRTLTIRPHGQGSVQEALVARCGDEVVASLSGDGVPGRTSTLRIACP